jgi:peroxiredoxin
MDRHTPGKDSTKTSVQESGANAHPSGHDSVNDSSQLLAAGVRAPDFSLHDTPHQIVSLSDFRGKRLILMFYPADWSPVCGDEVTLFNEVLPEFRKLNAELLGVSVDGAWCHIAFAKDRKLHFPLLADFEPKGAVAKAYGAYRQHDGTAERALFVIDEQGIIRWSYLSPIGINPGADGVLTALEELETKKGAAA